VTKLKQVIVKLYLILVGNIIRLVGNCG